MLPVQTRMNIKREHVGALKYSGDKKFKPIIDDDIHFKKVRKTVQLSSFRHTPGLNACWYKTKHYVFFAFCVPCAPVIYCRRKTRVAPNSELETMRSWNERSTTYHTHLVPKLRRSRTQQRFAAPKNIPTLFRAAISSTEGLFVVRITLSAPQNALHSVAVLAPLLW